MLPTGARLRAGRDIDAVVRHGVRASAGGVLTAHLYRNGAGGSPRAAFAVGRTAGNSVERNRIRRRLRHLLRDRLALLPAGTDLVLRAGAPALGASGRELSKALDSVLRRAADRLDGGSRERYVKSELSGPGVNTGGRRAAAVGHAATGETET